MYTINQLEIIRATIVERLRKDSNVTAIKTIFDISAQIEPFEQSGFNADGLFIQRGKDKVSYFIFADTFTSSYAGFDSSRFICKVECNYACALDLALSGNDLLFEAYKAAVAVNSFAKEQYMIDLMQSRKEQVLNLIRSNGLSLIEDQEESTLNSEVRNGFFSVVGDVCFDIRTGLNKSGNVVTEIEFFLVTDIRNIYESDALKEQLFQQPDRMFLRICLPGATGLKFIFDYCALKTHSMIDL